MSDLEVVMTAERDDLDEQARAAFREVRPEFIFHDPVSAADWPGRPSPPCARWARDGGLHIDPWIRTHQRLGASILAPAPRSMIISGTVAETNLWMRHA
jgi:hypothetical protein